MMPGLGLAQAWTTYWFELVSLRPVTDSWTPNEMGNNQEKKDIPTMLCL